ncbi:MULTISPECIES: hypothetical protein [Brevibacillus]|uniref:hypothetical protein n=1 Tax=Brevibacillus TaxID=55080 RepID=UPI00046991DF|nr:MULTISPECIES: hypothetical protein [Brevibacillus]MCC0567552.1 hypothetical protein [Brevibacillus borstelensis]MCM3561935.1 hypothetical protein [Brevibacillus borstelensis]MDH4617736.1 hypothetical protein [Brevibacillus sp. AY1]
MREFKLKIIDEFDKKLYPISLIDFRNKKISVHFRGNLENVYDIEDVHVIQSTELMDSQKNEVYEADLLSNGEKTYCVSYDNKKGGYFGINIHNQEKKSLHLLIKEKYIVIGNYYLR